MVPGIHGNAYQFASPQPIHLPAASSVLVGTAPFTASVWLRADPDSGPNQRTILAKPSSPATAMNVLALCIMPGGDARYESTPDGVTADYLVATGDDVATSTWRHLAVRWDGATRAIFIDGVQRATATNVIMNSGEPLVIGGDLDNNANTYPLFSGVLDDLRFYRRALRGDEIAILAQP